MTTDLATTDPQPDTMTAQIVARGEPLTMDTFARLGLWLAAAESNSNDPKARGMAAAVRLFYVDRLGLPAHAASEVHIIKGNLTLSAKLCRALAHNHGLRVERVEETTDSCTAAVVEIASGKELGRSVYTLAMAKKAGLPFQNRDGSPANWATIPDRMLWARASKRALDDHAPWVTVGVMSVEEVEDIGEPLPPVVQDDVVDAVPFEETDS
jgi:hypothetical protein